MKVLADKKLVKEGKDPKKDSVAVKPKSEEGKLHTHAQFRPARQKDQTSDDMFEKVLSINRTTKVTKGGKKMGFSALVIVGDKKSKVGYGFGKANEVSDAIKKALNSAKNSMFEVPLKGSTIPHEVIGVYGAARVLLKPAGQGTGVIAGGATRAMCDAAGIRNILTKCLGSNNPFNIVKATAAGFRELTAGERINDAGDDLPE